MMAVAVTGWRWGMADSECALDLGLRVALGGGAASHLREKGNGRNWWPVNNQGVRKAHEAYTRPLEA